MRVGILGAGHIAEKMAHTLGRMQDCSCVAVGSRDASKAADFAGRFGIERSYGSYSELVKNPDVDLVYVATPHSKHFEHMMLCLENGKPVLCEKSFTMDARQAEKIFEEASRRNIFVTEAIWTRYEPFSATIRELAYSGVIGNPQVISASLCYPVTHKQRVMAPELGGGALLDVGVYTLNFARMIFGPDIVSVKSHSIVGQTGVDLVDSISLVYSDGRMANLQAGVVCANDRQGIISGTEGYIIVDNINNPLEAVVYAKDHTEKARYHAPEQITGFEYQVTACVEALRDGLTESPFMPHQETEAIMKMMDALRTEWGVRYEFER